MLICYIYFSLTLFLHGLNGLASVAAASTGFTLGRAIKYIACFDRPAPGTAHLINIAEAAEDRAPSAQHGGTPRPRAAQSAPPQVLITLHPAFNEPAFPDRTRRTLVTVNWHR